MDSEKRLIDRKSMEKQGAKKRRRREEDCSTDMDRISQLPPPTVHHILSFLSQKEAVQTCLLSKSWRYLWNARPNFEFREEWFMGKKEKFLSVLGNTLQRYHDQNLSIQQLNLEMRMLDDDPKLVSLLGKWIPIIMLNLKTFKLRLFSFSPKNFDMPSVVFRAKSLQELDLMNCKLNFDNNLLMLSNLRKLCFQACYVNESRTVIHVPTSTLESILTTGSPNWFFHPENTYFPHLKSLHLSRVNLSAESFDKFSSKHCPCLEKLRLDNCKDFKGFQLSSRSITHLEISIYKNIDGFKGAIDAPNILYFKFSGCAVPSISFTTTSSEWESHICLDGRRKNDAFRFNHDLKELLKALSHSRIYLELHPVEHRHIEDIDSGGKPVQVEVLNCKSRGGWFKSSSFPALMNCLLRTCRPRCIEMSFVEKELFCALWGRGRAKPVESRLCKIILGDLEITSWKKDLEKVSMEVWNKNAGDWCSVEGHMYTDVCPQDVWKEKQDIHFRLKWRE